ncbi:MAG: CFI-box-CTERM domain-containing protein [Dehalococcoidia bacterium]
MKMIPNSRKRRYVARVSIFLIAVALIAGTIGCEPAARYNLTVSSTEGGKVASPGEGTFSCYGRRGVILIAAPSTGYHFVNWTGNVSTIADVNSAATTITMCGDCSIMANFEKSVGGGCFIATAAYGTPMAEEIQILREFRDEYLLTNSMGQGLVGVYYTISPPIADFISEHPSLKLIVRAGLMPVVSMCSIVFDIVPQFAGNEP